MIFDNVTNLCSTYQSPSTESTSTAAAELMDFGFEPPDTPTLPLHEPPRPPQQHQLEEYSTSLLRSHRQPNQLRHRPINSNGNMNKRNKPKIVFGMKLINIGSQLMPNPKLVFKVEQNRLHPMSKGAAGGAAASKPNIQAVS